MRGRSLIRIGGIVVGCDGRPVRSALQPETLDTERATSQPPISRTAGRIDPRERAAREVAIGVAERLGAPLQLEPFERRTTGGPEPESSAPGSDVMPLSCQALEEQIREVVRTTGSCLHVSIQGFLPEADPDHRVDVGVLYAPELLAEAAMAARLLAELRHAALDAHPNAPYPPAGTALTRVLRDHFDPSQYAGLDIACSDDLLLDPSGPPAFARLLAHAVRAVVQTPDPSDRRDSGIRPAGRPWDEESRESQGEDPVGGRNGRQ